MGLRFGFRFRFGMKTVLRIGHCLRLQLVGLPSALWWENVWKSGLGGVENPEGHCFDAPQVFPKCHLFAYLMHFITALAALSFPHKGTLITFILSHDFEFQ